MIDHKICVPVCAANADRLIEKIKQAEQIADIVEIRFDCLEKEELSPAGCSNIFTRLAAFEKTKPWIATFRAADQGGPHDLTRKERIRFWESAPFFDYIDLEEDIFGMVPLLPNVKTIASFHDFVSKDIAVDAVYRRLVVSRGDIIKIAVIANDAHEATPVFKLLEKSKNEGKQIIPIAMGEAAKWTRILGPARGAFLTFASNNAGESTAPGQISASEIRDVYRVGELDASADTYGIIARDTSYTASPYIHNAAFRALDINAVFVPFQVADLAQFMRRMVLEDTREIDLNFKGFAVTNPHKESIIPYVDVLDKTACTIGAVNTIKIHRGKIYGYNTDAEGFAAPLRSTVGNLENTNAAIFGAGGAARSCIYALKQANAKVALYARDVVKGKRTCAEFDIRYAGDFKDFDSRNVDIVINTTPLGTKGKNESAAVLDSKSLAGVDLVYDLVYNPLKTVLMAEAEKAGAATIGGIEMLIAQAAEQFRIWTGQTAPAEIMRNAAISRL